MKKPAIAIIGSGFAGLSAATILANKGFSVTVFEKNEQAGGRARIWEKDGFRFDMGPSWYWMPDVFENYFSLFDKKIEDMYQLVRLDPSYRIYFGKGDTLDIPAKMNDLEKIFEELEPGSSKALRKFLSQAKYKYEKGMGDYVFRPSASLTEFIDWNLIKSSFRMQLFTSMRKHVHSLFKHPKLIQLLEFPVLFLGATADKTPAMYSMMNYADLALGTWYPMGGMNEIVKAMVSVAQEKGVQFRFNSEVLNIVVNDKKASGINTSTGYYEANLIISNADYEHTDQTLTPSPYRNYSAKYWDTRTLSPSCLIFYIGINKKLEQLKHHNLFFDEALDEHAREIYVNPKWPEKPLFYVCCPSKTDPDVAPEGCENLFMLMPLAPGLHDDDELREKYYHLMLERLEKLTGEGIKSHVMVKRSYAMADFTKDYYSFKGNAYGLANTLSQTAYFKPNMYSKKVSNLLFTGQFTVPGPGVPAAIISGQVVAKETEKYFNKVK